MHATELRVVAAIILMFILKRELKFKVTLCKDDNARFTTIPLKAV